MKKVKNNLLILLECNNNNKKGLYIVTYYLDIINQRSN